MSRRATEDRIAHLQAQAHAQRLATQLAIFEAREQLAPLRSAAGVLSMAVRALSPGGAAGGTIGRLARFGVGHPWLSSTVERSPGGCSAGGDRAAGCRGGRRCGLVGAPRAGPGGRRRAAAE